MLKISQAKFEDFEFLLSNAKREGWNPGLYDALPFFRTDPKGFFIASNGKEKVGCISAVAYNEFYGFIGFYIVLPEYRHHGFGHEIWEHGLKYLGHRVIGLDGVLAQQQNYEKSGFKLYYKSHRFEGSGSGIFSNDLIDLKGISLEQLLKYDEPIYGFERSVFLREWLQMPNAFGLGKIIKGSLAGYGVLRSCYNGFKIGPLFADDQASALEIYHALCAQAGNSPVFLDVPEANREGMKMAESLALKSNFQTVRMYTKSPPQPNLDKVFGVTTFELG